MAKVHPIRPATVVLVGSESLIGREIRDVIASGYPDLHLRLLAAKDEEEGLLTEQEGEPAIVGRLDEHALAAACAVFLAGSPESGRQTVDAAAESQFIDLTYALEDDTRARLRAPMVEPESYEVPADAIHVVAHPAAIAIALVLSRLHEAYPLRRSVVHVFEPASERGSAGVDELQQQTVNLLSFKPLPKSVFDAQVGFTMLAGYGEEAPVSLEDIELRIERHVATLLSIGSKAPLPSLRLIQAPVFHGYSFSVWVEFESNPGLDAIEDMFSSPPFDLRASGMEPPTNVGVAGQSGLAAGGIALDRNHPRCCWIWMATDNLRLMAENAVAVARQLI